MDFSQILKYINPYSEVYHPNLTPSYVRATGNPNQGFQNVSSDIGNYATFGPSPDPNRGVLAAIDTRLPGGGAGRNPAPNPTPNPGPTGPSEFDLAQRARDNRIASIRGMFDRTKSQANDIRNQATTTFNDLLKAVTAFRERAGTQFANAGQEITNSASQILGGNARTAQEALGTSRALGRSLGLGDSSKFNQQNKVIGSLAGTQGSALAARGENNRSNRLAYDERLSQAQSQEDEATRFRDALNTQARQLEETGLGQFGDDTRAAEDAFGSSLNGIINYQRQLAQINPVQAAGLAQYDPNFSGITNTLNGVLPTAGATPAAGVDPNAGANLAYDPTIQALLKRRGSAYIV